MCRSEISIAQQFVYEVGQLAKKNYFVVTDGASGISNNGNQAVKHARNEHVKWEQSHGQDPHEDWTHMIKD